MDNLKAQLQQAYMTAASPDDDGDWALRKPLMELQNNATTATGIATATSTGATATATGHSDNYIHSTPSKDLLVSTGVAIAELRQETPLPILTEVTSSQAIDNTRLLELEKSLLETKEKLSLYQIESEKVPSLELLVQELTIQLSHQQEESRKIIDTMKKELSSSQDKITDLTHQLSLSQDSVNTYRDNLTKLELEISKEKEITNQDVSELKNQLIMSQSVVDEKVELITSLQLKITDFEQQVALYMQSEQAQQQTQQQAQQQSDLSSDLSTTIDSLRHELEQQKSELVATQSKNMQLESTIQTMEAQFIEKQDEISSIQSQLQSKIDEVDTIATTVAATINDAVTKAVEEAVTIEKSYQHQLQLDKSVVEQSLIESQTLVKEKDESLTRKTEEFTLMLESKEGDIVTLRNENHDLKEALTSSLHSLVSLL